MAHMTKYSQKVLYNYFFIDFENLRLETNKDCL